MQRLAETFIRFRKVIAIFVVLATVAALYGVSQLRIDDVPRSIFRSQDAEFERFERVFSDFGSDDNDCVLVFEAPRVFAGETLALIRRIDRELTALEGVDDVASLADIVVPGTGLLPTTLIPRDTSDQAACDAAEEQARTHSLVENTLLSESGKTTVMVVRLAGENLAISAMEPVVKRVEARLDELLEGRAERARLTGVPPIRVVIFHIIGREQVVFGAAGALLGFLIGFAIFRRGLPVLITSGSSILAGFWAMGALGLLGEPITILTSQMPLLMMVIAFTDAVHLMIDQLRARQQGTPALVASRESIRHLGAACALTSLTTAIGFASLGFSRVEAIQRFGLLFAGGIALTFIVVLTVVPLAGGRVLRGKSPDALGTRWGKQRERYKAWLNACMNHAKLISVLGVLSTVGLLLLAMQLEPDNRLTEATPQSHPAVQALLHLEQEFGGSTQLAVLCEWPEDDKPSDEELFDVLAETTAILRAEPFTHGPLSAIDLARAVRPQADASTLAASLALLPEDLTRRFLRRDLGRALVTARIPDAGSRDAEPAYRRIEAELARLAQRHAPVQLYPTGTSYMARRNVNFMISDFALGLGVAAIVIFGVLSIAFRSLLVGLLSILPNAFPLVVAAAVLQVLDLELQMVSALAFSVCLGIAVDDTIHFLTRFKRELREGAGSVREAAVNAIIGVGRALLVTTAVLLGGFGVMLLSDIPTTQLFAKICCLGLLSALIGDLLFLPALLVVFFRAPNRHSPASSAELQAPLPDSP